MRRILLMMGLCVLGFGALAACARPAPDVIEVTRAVVATAPAAEGTIVERCTTMGCLDTLTVAFAEPPPAFTAVLTIGARTETAVCEAGVWRHSEQLPCDIWTLPLDSAPVDVRVELRRGNDRLLDETLPVVYQTVHPNGPNCEPACRVGVVTVTVPAYP